MVYMRSVVGSWRLRLSRMSGTDVESHMGRWMALYGGGARSLQGGETCAAPHATREVKLESTYCCRGYGKTNQGRRRFRRDDDLD
jgi:hypothetical protein